MNIYKWTALNNRLSDFDIKLVRGSALLYTALCSEILPIEARETLAVEYAPAEEVVGTNLHSSSHHRRPPQHIPDQDLHKVRCSDQQAKHAMKNHDECNI